MKLYAILVFLALMFAGYNCAVFTWTGLGNDNNYNNPLNWAPNTGVPGSADNATIAATLVTVSSSVTVNALTITSAVRLVVTNGATLTLTSDFFTFTGMTLQVDTGSSFITQNYITLSGTVNFQNFGTVQLNPLFTAGVTLSNVQNGNPVVFTGVRPIQFLGAGTYNIPTGFMFDTSRQQQFQALTGAATVNFKYTENINSNGWQVANDLTNVVSFTFESGVVVNGALTLRSSATTQPRPTVTFAGTSTINTASTWDAIPVIGTGPGTTVTINGNTLGFTNQPVTFNTPALQGTTALSFSNGNTGNLAATFQRAITISAPTPTFSGQWLLTGSDVTLTQATTFSFNMLINANLQFLRGFTFGQGAVIQNNGAGRFTFTDNATSSVGGALDLLTNPVTLACNPPANTFALLGNSFTFSAGLTINACTVSASSSLIIKGQVATTGGNSTLPNTSTVSFFNTDFTFSATNNPASGLYGITVPGALSVPNGVSWTASNVEVTSPAGNTFTLQDNASLRSQNNGLFSINGNLAIGSSCSIPALVAFGSTTISVSTSAKINWNGNILLRNTILGGTGEVWFFGNLVVTKGLSNITNPNFRFKSGFTAGYLFDGFGSNFGATLTINSNGATSNRVIEGSVTANTGVNVVFDDNLNFNNTATLTGTAAAGGAPPGCITFRTSSTLASITTNSAVTFQNFIFFNNTNPHLQGTGTFTFTNNPTVWLTGALNNPPANGDAPVNFNSPTTISLFVDSTVGSNVLFNAFLSTDDLDNNDNVASRTLTLASSGNQLRTVAGVSTKANVIFAGNVLYTAAGTLNDAGFLQINGNSLVLGASPTWNSPVIFNGGATTISTQNNAAATLTIGDQTPKHGFTLSASLTVNSPATLAFNAVVSVNLNNNANIGGSGTVNALNTFVNAPGASSLSPQTLILNNVTFVGTGPVALSPVDSTLQINTLVTAAVPVNYNGATVTLNGDTAVSPLLSFTANPVTIQGAGTLTIANAGSLNLATNWINNVPVVFNSPLTIATTGVLSGSGAITFNNTLTLTQSITLSQAITFGFDPNFVVAVLNSGFTLTLNGAVDITVKGIVLPTGSIVSTSPNNALQTITGGGVINSAWTWSNTVRFGTLNVTGMRTLNFDLVVKAGETACFVNGVVLNTGTFLADTAAGVKTLLIEPFLENNGNNTLGTDLTVRFSRGSSGTFEFRGTVPVMVNSTVMCEANFQFTQNVIFGWINANTANTITFKTFCFNWFNSAAVVQVWRNTLTVNNDVQVNVFPQIVFGMNNTNPVAVTTSGQGALTFQGSLTIAGKAFNTGAGISVGAISITTLQNATINALTLTGPVNFISTTSPWVEPLVMVRNGLSQTLTLTGPIRLDNPTFTSGTGFAGASRLAITSGFTADSSFTFNVPVQFYVNTQGQVFTVTLNNFGTVVNLAYSPSLFNPNFLNTNFPLDVMVKSTAFNTKFVTNANTSYALGNVEVMGTTLQLSSTNAQTITTRDITIRANSVFWVDNVNVNGQTVTFTDGAPGSVFQFTVSSLNPPRLNVATAYFRGSAVVSVNNFNWDGTAVTAINATASFQTQNTPFAVTTGTPGFQYQSVRNGQNAQFTRSANPTVSPFPTNSNGPSPAVSSSSVLSVNMLFFVLMSVLVFFF